MTDQGPASGGTPTCPPHPQRMLPEAVNSVESTIVTGHHNAQHSLADAGNVLEHSPKNALLQSIKNNPLPYGIAALTLGTVVAISVMRRNQTKQLEAQARDREAGLAR